MTDSLQRAPSGARNYTPAALNVLLFEDNAIDAALTLAVSSAASAVAAVLVAGELVVRRTVRRELKG